jgi:hypothetical protein
MDHGLDRFDFKVPRSMLFRQIQDQKESRLFLFPSKRKCRQKSLWFPIDVSCAASCFDLQSGVKNKKSLLLVILSLKDLI